MLPNLFHTVKSLVQFDVSAQDTFKPPGPIGVTVHYTADSGNIDRTAKGLVLKGLGYHLIIDRDGSVYQMVSLNRKVWHAGKAIWRGFAPNHHHIAISLVSWGHLNRTEKGVFESYSGAIIPPDQVVQRPDNLKGVTLPWHDCTFQQFSALMDTLRWCVAMGINPDDICGHDECALPPGRKMDPGGVLPISMEKLRHNLIAEAVG